MKLAERLQKARLTLLLDFPFFGQLALRLKPEIRPGARTAWTDGRIIAFDPDFCAQLSDSQLTWLYAHEVGHPALGHIFRLKGRNPEKWNIAADFKVNQMLEEVIHSKRQGHLRMERIPGTLLNPEYNGLSTEEIYHLLPEPPSEEEKQQPGSGGQIGDFEQPEVESNGGDDSSDEGGEGGQNPDGAAQTLEQMEQEWKVAVAQAATTERMKNQGQLPASLQFAIDELIDPAVPWQDLLRQFASKITRDDYSWSRPNRRHTGRGFILPTLRSEGLGHIVVAFDTSGSIAHCPDTLQAFLSELQGILDTCHPELITVIDCDWEVQATAEYLPGDDIRVHSPKGGGGTAFEPVFDEVDRRGLEPAALLYFTDLWGSFPEVPPNYPTLWLNYGDPTEKAPFGETLHVA